MSFSLAHLFMTDLGYARNPFGLRWTACEDHIDDADACVPLTEIITPDDLRADSTEITVAKKA